MATLKTQGFQVSALPRSPRVPPQIGMVDVKAIDEGVRRGLATFEAIRQAPRSMILADAQMDAKTAQAPLATRGLLAETQAAEERLPLQTQGLSLQNQALAEQLPIKTEMLALQRENQRLKNIVAEAESTPEFLEARRKRMLLSSIPSDVRGLTMLTENMTPEDAERARRVRLGLDPRISSAAIQYKTVIGADGRERLVAVDPREVGAQVIGSGETYGSGVGNPALPAIATTPAVAAPVTVTPEVDELGNPIVQATNEPVTAASAVVATTAAEPTNVNLFASQTPAERKGQETTAAKTAETQIEARAKLPKALSTIKSLESKSKNVDADIDEAIKRTNNYSAGYGAIFKNWPRTQAMALDSILTSIRANNGFETLLEMRLNSPTGGALGNVSDFEGRQLQSAISELRQAAEPKDLIAALNKVKERRQQALKLTKEQFDREVKFFGLSDADFTLQAQQAKQPLTLPGEQPASATEWSDQNEKRLQELRAKLGK